MRNSMKVLLVPVAVALAAAVTLAGCGGDGAPVTQSGEHVRGPAVDYSTPAPATADAQVANVQPEDTPVVTKTPDAAAGTAAELPPDVTVSVADTLVAPGSAVEVTAQATSDVTQLVLWDGLGDREGFTYDPTAGVWRAAYRVPLKSPWERIGLSVTARNDSDRWRRVWVFLKLQEPAAAPKADVADGS